MIFVWLSPEFTGKNDNVRKQDDSYGCAIIVIHSDKGLLET